VCSKRRSTDATDPEEQEVPRTIAVLLAVMVEHKIGLQRVCAADAASARLSVSTGREKQMFGGL